MINGLLITIENGESVFVPALEHKFNIPYPSFYKFKNYEIELTERIKSCLEFKHKSKLEREEDIINGYPTRFKLKRAI